MNKARDAELFKQWLQWRHCVAQGVVKDQVRQHCPTCGQKRRQMGTRQVETATRERRFLALSDEDQKDRIVKLLTPREAQVVRMRLGIAEDRRSTLAEIANRFAVSVERARQVHRGALVKLVGE